MYRDRYSFNYTKLKYKFGVENTMEYIKTLKESFYKEINLLDFNGRYIVYLPEKVPMKMQNIKALMKSYEGKPYGIQAMEEEIMATLSIEQIDTTRESVRNILYGSAPKSEEENKAFAIKRGLDFIADPANKITEENLYQLYTLSIGEFLEEESKLIPWKKYRDDAVYVVGRDITHQGLNYKLIPDYIKNMIYFIKQEDDIDEIIKSSIIHYYLAYIHPYFDGNGRMARLLQLWYLVQKGYTASLFIPLSFYINKSKGLYYKSFNMIMDNYKLSNILDITPFIEYYIKNVLEKLEIKQEDTKILDQFQALLSNGEITEKEKALFYFVLSAYGEQAFSTKQLEKDYKDVAYATVRTFVRKMEDKGLFTSQRYSNRIKYKVKVSD
jgi:Fic family protein